jgi:hypothetical protein
MGDFTADPDFSTIKNDIVPGSSQQPKCGSFIEYSAGLT